MCALSKRKKMAIIKLTLCAPVAVFSLLLLIIVIMLPSKTMTQLIISINDTSDNNNSTTTIALDVNNVTLITERDYSINNNKSSSSAAVTQLRQHNITTTTTTTPLIARVVFVKSAPTSNSDGSDLSAAQIGVVQIRPKSADDGMTSTLANNNSVSSITLSTPTDQGSTTTQKGPLLVLAEWSYEEMNNWGKVSTVCAQGSNQSPVSLTLEDAYTARNFAIDPLVFRNYDTKTLVGNLTNNGHTIIWTIDSQQQSKSMLPLIGGSGYGSATFVLDHLLFHWGADNLESNCKGSEHVVDYQPSPLEVHFAHRNIKYQNYDEAQFKPDGLATISFLFRVVDDTKNVTAVYARIVDALPDVKKPNSTIGLTLDVTEILPSFASSSQSIFYRYDGSQTAPPCFETVSWTVFQERIPIPLRHLQAFRRSLQIKAPNWSNKLFQPMENNYRPIQMKNGRTIWTNGKGYASDGTSIDANNDMAATAFAFTMLTLTHWIAI